MPTPGPEAEELCARITRMKTLCDQLEAAEGDRQRYNELIERIRRESESFRQTLATHHPR